MPAMVEPGKIEPDDHVAVGLDVTVEPSAMPVEVDDLADRLAHFAQVHRFPCRTRRRARGWPEPGCSRLRARDAYRTPPSAIAVVPCTAAPTDTTCKGSPSTSVSFASTSTTAGMSSSVSASSSTASGGSFTGVTFTVAVSPPGSLTV